MFQRINVLLFATLVICHCSSTVPNVSTPLPFEKAPLAGMIYSSAGRPIRGAHIRIDTGIRTQSDINGRFVSEPIPPGRHYLIISRQGFETRNISIEFSDRLQVLYVRLASLDHLLQAAETEIDRGELEKAAELLERAATAAAEDPALLMLKLVVAVQGEDQKGINELSEILSRRSLPVPEE